MRVSRAEVVRSRAGHDKGELLCVLEVRDGYVMVADGKRRKVGRPKRKREKHVEAVGMVGEPVRERVQAGQPVGDGELRKALATLRDELEV